MKLSVAIISLLVLITSSFSTFSFYAHRKFTQERKELSDQLTKMEKDFFAPKNNPFIFHYFVFSFFKEAINCKPSQYTGYFNVFSDECLPVFLSQEQKQSCQKLLGFYSKFNGSTQYDKVKSDLDPEDKFIGDLDSFLHAIFFHFCEANEKSPTFYKDAVELLNILHDIDHRYGKFKNSLLSLNDMHSERFLGELYYVSTSGVQYKFGDDMRNINELITYFTNFDDQKRLNAIFLSRCQNKILSYFKDDIQPFLSFLKRKEVELVTKFNLKTFYESLTQTLEPVIKLCFQTIEEQQFKFIIIKDDFDYDSTEIFSFKGTELSDEESMVKYFRQNNFIPEDLDHKNARIATISRITFFLACLVIQDNFKHLERYEK